MDQYLCELREQGKPLSEEFVVVLRSNFVGESIRARPVRVTNTARRVSTCHMPNLVINHTRQEIPNRAHWRHEPT